MPLVNMLFNPTPKSVGGITIDAFMAEHYEFTNNVTKLPIEDGSVITDHVTSNPTKISVEGLMGNTAFVVASEGQITSSSANPMQRVIDCYNALLKLTQDRMPISIILGLDVFDNMVITSFNVDRDVATGANLAFTMELEHITVVTSQLIAQDLTLLNGGSEVGGVAAGQTSDTQNAGTSATEQPERNMIKEEWRRQVRNGGPATAKDYERKFGVPYPQ